MSGTTKNTLLERSKPGNRPRTLDEVVAVLAAKSALNEDGCQEWIGTRSNDGYGRLTWAPEGGDGPRIRGAHRVSYWIANGLIPDGMFLDHLCRNRACIRPDHLEPVTGRENVMRSPIALGAINAAKTECANGHPYSDENTRVMKLRTRKTTVRVCKTCELANRLRYEAGLRAARR